MTVNKGLTSLVNSSPNFSNQALENAINDIKAVDKDDGYQFIKSQFDVDTAIHNNTVLTTSQKNDALETLYAAQSHLQIGRYLNDIVRHTNTILDGSILGVIEGIEDFPRGGFLEILQMVQSLQTTLPSLYGVSAKEKSRGVNDHLGTLNNIFIETEDSSAPVFTRLKDIMQLIDINARTTTALNTATAAVRFSNNALVTFLSSVVADSTDFQTSLDNAVNTAAGNMANLNTRISQIAGDPTTDLVAIRDSITTQQNLENTNITSLRTYIESQSDYQAYVGLADDDDLRKLMARVAQNSNWITYFTDYKLNESRSNPIYTTTKDSDKSAVIDQVLRSSGLPDVLDPLDLDAVADKAKRDDRIDTKGFDRIFVEDQIISSCRQLNIDVSGKDIYELSRRLLNNMNQNDRDKIALALDLNEQSNTLS